MCNAPTRRCMAQQNQCYQETACFASLRAPRSMGMLWQTLQLKKEGMSRREGCAEWIMPLSHIGCSITVYNLSWNVDMLLTCAVRQSPAMECRDRKLQHVWRIDLMPKWYLTQPSNLAIKSGMVTLAWQRGFGVLLDSFGTLPYTFSRFYILDMTRSKHNNHATRKSVSPELRLRFFSHPCAEHFDFDRFCMAPLWTARWSKVPRPFFQRPNLCQCPGNHVNIPRVKHGHTLLHLPMHPNAGFPCLQSKVLGLFFRPFLLSATFGLDSDCYLFWAPQDLPQNLPLPRTHLEPSQEPSQNLCATHPKP